METDKKELGMPLWQRVTGIIKVRFQRGVA